MRTSDTLERGTGSPPTKNRASIRNGTIESKLITLTWRFLTRTAVILGPVRWILVRIRPLGHLGRTVWHMQESWNARHNTSVHSTPQLQRKTKHKTHAYDLRPSSIGLELTPLKSLFPRPPFRGHRTWRGRARPNRGRFLKPASETVSLLLLNVCFCFCFCFGWPLDTRHCGMVTVRKVELKVALHIGTHLTLHCLRNTVGQWHGFYLQILLALLM